MVRWPCSCWWEECSKWAKSKKNRLISRHHRIYQEQQRFHDAEILANIRNNFHAASAENVHNQVDNNDNHHVANDPQPVGNPPDIPGAGCKCLLPQPLPMRHPQTLSEQQSAAREEFIWWSLQEIRHMNTTCNALEDGIWIANHITVFESCMGISNNRITCVLVL